MQTNKKQMGMNALANDDDAQDHTPKIMQICP